MRNLPFFVALPASIVAVLLLAASTDETTTIYPALQEPEHKPIFHNDFVDAYEVRLRAGQGTAYHRHTHDQLGIVLNRSTGGNQKLGEAETLSRTAPGTVTFVPHSTLGGTTHRVRAVAGEFHVIGIEFAQDSPKGSRTVSAPPGERLEFPQGNAAVVRLAPGESRAIPGELLVPLTAGTLVDLSSGRRLTLSARRPRWFDSPPHVGAMAVVGRSNCL